MRASPEIRKTADTTEEKDSHSWTGWIVWPVGILVLYMLSVGPVVMMYENGHFSPRLGQIFGKFYAPLFCAYEKTPLHKPIGMYLHLWVPDFLNKSGEPKWP